MSGLASYLRFMIAIRQLLPILILSFLMSCTSQGPTDRMLYSSDENGNSDIYLMNLTNNKVIQLTESPYDEWAATWVSTHEISFLRQRGNIIERHVLYLYTGMEEKVDMPKACDLDDKNSVYNGRGEGLFTCGQEVFIQATPDSAFTLLHSDSASFQYVQWDHNDEDVLFTSNRSGSNDIYMYDRSEKKVIPITADSNNNERAVASPDGKYISYSTNADRDHQQIAVVNRSTNDIQFVNITGANNALTSSWSWDGKILYVGADIDGSWKIVAYHMEYGSTEVIVGKDGVFSGDPKVYRPAYRAD